MRFSRAARPNKGTDKTYKEQQHKQQHKQTQTQKSIRKALLFIVRVCFSRRLNKTNDKNFKNKTIIFVIVFIYLKNYNKDFFFLYNCYFLSDILVFLSNVEFVNSCLTLLRSFTIYNFHIFH